MNDLNYISGIVKILESPNFILNKNEISSTQFRVQLPQFLKKEPTSIIILSVWGSLANDVAKYYQVNDYILIEGYISIRTSIIQSDRNKKINDLQINVKKILPLFLS